MVAVAVSVSACSNLVSQAYDAEKAGDYKTAVAVYRDRLKAEPDDLAALKGLAADLYIMGGFDDALPVQEKVVALDPKEAQTRVELGFNYLNHQHDAAKAVAVLVQAVDLEPTAKYLTFLAQAEIAAGDPGKAEDALRRAIASDKTYGHSYGVFSRCWKGRVGTRRRPRCARPLNRPV